MNLVQRRLAPFLPGPGNPPVSDGELATFILCVLVTTIGLTGDIARHLGDPASLDNNDFLSGWHLVLYGGVMAVGAFIGIGAIRRGPGYVGSVSTGFIGFALLSLGGMADAAWHAAYGTEAAVEALVSPPHLLVFAGLAFLLTAPVVVLWKRDARQLGVVPSIAAVVSVVSTVLVTTLFTGFLSPLSGGLSLQGFVEPLVGESAADYDVVRGLAIGVWTAALLAAAVTILLVRFRLVPGVLFVGFVLMGLPPLFVRGANVDGSASTVDVLNPLTVGFALAGVAAELCMALFGRPTLGRIGASVTGAAVAATMWSGTFLVLRLDERLAWTKELWGGTITLSAMVGATVAALIALPVDTGRASPGGRYSRVRADVG